MRLLILLWFLLALAGRSEAAVHTVTSDEEMDTAIAALEDGDTITVAGSFTSDAIYLIENNVTINSTATTNTITLGDDLNYVFQFASGSAGSSISGFTIDGDKDNRTAGTCIGVLTPTITVSSMIVKDGFSYNILVGAGATSDVLITGNTSYTPGGAGITKTTTGEHIRCNSGSVGTISNNTLTGDASGSAGIFLNGADGWTITGNTITNTGQVPIKVYGAANSTTVSNNWITDWGLDETNTDGIYVHGTNCVISGNSISQTVDNGAAYWCIELTGGAGVNDGTVISGNKCSGAYLDEGISGGGSAITVTRNWIEATDEPIEYENCSGSVYSYNVLILTGTGNALELDSNAAGARNVDVWNNTVYNSGGSGNGIVFVETTGTWSDIDMKNNIIVGFTKGVVVYGAGAGLTHTNNSYFGNTANLQTFNDPDYANIELDASETTTDPLFSDAAAGVFRLLRGSPAIDAGVDVGLTTDHDGNGFRGTVDIGAYEYYPPQRSQ